ncbi:hypothetical protein [Arcobacter sp. L]|uniref:hypothetical protein n=1 Tax=Arcobacter sp. L TaxID=944547 RepID=UPI0002295DA0|nr:hypothetical protein [Arcobacter sp. L]BAK72691.1 hypothetical protein ABLL_0816 [Arcobacter sp. L]
MNLYIVESPFQLLSAVEASKYFNNEKSLFVIKYNKKESNVIQLKKIKDLFKLNNVIEIKPLLSNFDSNLQLLLLLKKFDKEKKNFNRIFIGEYRSFHMRKFFDYFSKAESYCLDDGNITYQIFQLIKEKKDEYYFNNGIKGLIKEIVYKMQPILFGLNNLEIKRNIKLFTCFDIPKENKHIIHDFSNIKKEYKVSNSKNIVYFYGSYLEIIGISKEKQIEFLEQAMGVFKKLDLEIIYLPHRLESEDKLNLIKDKLNLKIVKNEFPAEIQLLVDGFIPECIASFGSSVLISLPKIFPEIKNVYSFFPTSSILPNRYLEEWEEMKKNYKKSVKVVELK